MDTKLEVKVPYSEEIPLVLLDTLRALGIPCDFAADNGSGALLITMGQVEDRALLALWECLSELRVRYIEACQEARAEQLTLEGL